MDTIQAPVAPPRRRVGRPSLRAVRSQQIVDAFIELVAVRGLEHVNLDDVAEAARIQRAAIRHFVGNRDDLVCAAINEIARQFLGDLTGSPTFPEFAAALLAPATVTKHATNTDAWSALFSEAVRRPETRPVIKNVYETLLSMIVEALRRSHPGAAKARIDAAAYTIACIGEHHFIFQQMGFPPERSEAALEAVLALAARLDD